MSLQKTLSEIAQNKKSIVDTRIKAAARQQKALQMVQLHYNNIQQLQRIAYGQSSPWNVGVAYRIPRTNLNLSLGHQGGRSNVQLSCVPDDSANLLRRDGFTD